ncbi:hypothetical protein Clacol_005800 [Clathrus columnatus]|uniref:Uncharacterized protein n=1 Tax=Clathrus columnatus TaxID=1419009 RepID=A0AAV5AAA9_9AGAM|nr:hypothetical protein Clacol_005800 [Clathrus columnatus]
MLTVEDQLDQLQPALKPHSFTEEEDMDMTRYEMMEPMTALPAILNNNVSDSSEKPPLLDYGIPLRGDVLKRALQNLLGDDDSKMKFVSVTGLLENYLSDGFRYPLRIREAFGTYTESELMVRIVDNYTPPDRYPTKAEMDGLKQKLGVDLEAKWYLDKDMPNWRPN